MGVRRFETMSFDPDPSSCRAFDEVAGMLSAEAVEYILARAKPLVIVDHRKNAAGVDITLSRADDGRFELLQTWPAPADAPDLAPEEAVAFRERVHRTKEHGAAL